MNTVSLQAYTCKKDQSDVSIIRCQLRIYDNPCLAVEIRVVEKAHNPKFEVLRIRKSSDLRTFANVARVKAISANSINKQIKSTLAIAA